MKRFLLGLAVGAAAIYAASKLISDETKENICDDLQDAADDAKDRVRSGLRYSRGRAMRVGVRARQEVREGRRKLSRATGDLADRLTDDLNQLEEKLREKTSGANS